MAYELIPGEGAAKGVLRCAREQLDRATTALGDELAADPVGAIHTARKAIKKERALLRMARGALPNRRRRELNATLRGAARRLSGFRDTDVMIQTLDRLAERSAGQLPSATVGAVRRQLEAERDGQSAAARSAQIEQALEELRALRVDADSWTLRGDGWAMIEPGLVRTYRDGRKALREARKNPTLETLHAWRKRVKDGWYELRLLAAVCGPAVGGQAQEAEQLAELLGEEHDLGVLEQKLKALAPDVAADTDVLLARIEARRDQLRTDARVVAQRVYAERPGAFRRRLERCWRAGEDGPAQPTSKRRPKTRANASPSP